MNDKTTRPLPPSLAQFAVEQLAGDGAKTSGSASRAEELIACLEAEIAQRDARIEEQAREIERLRLNIADYNEHERCYQAEIAALKAQPSGVVVTGMADALRHVVKELDSETPEDIDYAQVSGALGVYTLFGPILNSPPVSAGVVDEREAFEEWADDKGFCLDCKFFEEGNNYESADTRMAFDIWMARAALTAQPDHSAQSAVQICNLGNYGSAYDLPGTCRAYTYVAQPGNDIAYRLGGCLRAAHADGGGDHIDFGLALLHRLQDKGFGVFQLAAATTGKESE